MDVEHVIFWGVGVVVAKECDYVHVPSCCRKSFVSGHASMVTFNMFFAMVSFE